MSLDIILTIDYSSNISIGQAARMQVPRMYYTNFDNAITEKYHVVLEGWPLEKFCNPSDIRSRTEISVLMTSFESGATRFRKLSTTEFEQWCEKRCLANLANGPGPSNASSPSTPPSVVVPPPVSLTQDPVSLSQDPVSNEGAGAPTTSVDFINTGVTTANGTVVMVKAKARKPRADKGKKRGPRAK